MAGTTPIRLGSATSGWTFESGSAIQTSTSGIQSISVKALWPDASTVLSNLPAYGSSVSVVEPSGFIPSSFILDLVESGHGIEYVEAGVARVTFRYKRQDPARLNLASRTVFVDTIINYDTELLQSSFAVVGLGGTVSGSFTQAIQNRLGFPEPQVTVTYNSTTEPTTGANIYALPGSARAIDFPSVSDISIPQSFPVAAGTLVQYFNGLDYISETATVDTTYNMALIFKTNPKGWQLTKMQYSPVGARSFFDVEEQWRNFYFAFGVQFISRVPPLPP